MTTTGSEVPGTAGGTSGSGVNAAGGGQKCGACGSTSIDVDPSRAEAVCTNCGEVLESNLIVAGNDHH